MPPALNALQTMARLIRDDSTALLARWRLQVRQLPSARHLDIPTLNDHIPDLLEELAVALESNAPQTAPDASEVSEVSEASEASAPAHGRQRLKDGFDIEEVVSEYNILRGCLHDLATEHGVTLQGRTFHVLNQVFDQAIGQALQHYADQRALEVQRRREEYLAFVVHDLRTPLSAISLAGRVLEKSLAAHTAADDVQRMLRAMRRNVQQLEGLVLKVQEENNHLQADSGLTLVRRRFDLWPQVEALIEVLHPMASAAHCRLLNLVPDDLTLVADAALVRRVFQNLIGNAIKFAPQGEIRIGAQADATGRVDCWVSDNGAGIDPDLLPRVFDKGESGDDLQAGTGLGLAIVKTFVEAHGGTVTVESAPGQGTTFRFRLPQPATAG